MDKFWCRLPFIHSASSPNGSHLVCCEGKGNGSKISDGIGPYDFINSDFMNNVRDGFLSEAPKENEYVKLACSTCINREEKFGKSKRTRDEEWRKLDRKSEKTNQENLLLKENITRHKNGLPIETISSIHMQGFGNHCNLTCVMCNSNHSDKWAKWLNDGNIVKFSTEAVETIIEQYKNLAGETLYIDISGGEPLLQEEVPLLFSRLKEAGVTVELSVTTNGTVPVKVLKSLFDNVNKGNVTISLDGIGKVGEYIRAGTNWERYEENVFDYNVYANKHGQLSINHFTTIQALNIGHIDDILEWIDNNHNSGPFRHHFLLYPDFLRHTTLPHNIRKKYLENTSDRGKKYVGNALTLKSEDYRFNTFIEYLNKTDLKNGTNWKDIWPEFQEYVNES